jgi:hypothetical protein
MTTKAQILKAIRKNCLECSCGSETDVRECRIVECQLHPFRMGKDPHPGRTFKNPTSGRANIAREAKINGGV